MPLARRVDGSAWARGNATGLQARLEFGDSLQGLFSQCAAFTSDFGLARALDVWYATVEGGDELLQMTELARSIRSTNLLVAGHHPSSWPLTSGSRHPSASTSKSSRYQGSIRNRRDTGDEAMSVKAKKITIDTRIVEDHVIARGHPLNTCRCGSTICNVRFSTSLVATRSVLLRPVFIEEPAMMQEETGGDPLVLERSRREAFVSILAHELRQPLGALLAAVEVVRMTSNSATARRATEIMTRQIHQMNRLMDDLLDETRWARGKMTLRRERLDLREVMKDAALDVAAAVAERGHALVVDPGLKSSGSTPIGNGSTRCCRTCSGTP